MTHCAVATLCGCHFDIETSISLARARSSAQLTGCGKANRVMRMRRRKPGDPLPPRGRPPLGDEDVRGRRIIVALSRRELEAVKGAARAEHVAPAVWARDAVLEVCAQRQLDAAHTAPAVPTAAAVLDALTAAAHEHLTSAPLRSRQVPVRPTPHEHTPALGGGRIVGTECGYGSEPAPEPYTAVGITASSASAPSAPLRSRQVPVRPMEPRCQCGAPVSYRVRPSSGKLEACCAPCRAWL